MKRLATLAILACLVTPAFAFYVAPGPDAVLNSFELTCTPPLNRRDRDPVVRIHLAVTIDRNTTPTEFEIRHETMSGHFYSRTEQYELSQLWQLGDVTSWTGYRKRHPEQIGSGELWHNREQWFYEEWFYTGTRQRDHVKSTCMPIEGE
jgi:hypothetical protein